MNEKEQTNNEWMSEREFAAAAPPRRRAAAPPPALLTHTAVSPQPVPPPVPPPPRHRQPAPAPPPAPPPRLPGTGAAHLTGMKLASTRPAATCGASSAAIPFKQDHIMALTTSS